MRSWKVLAALAVIASFAVGPVLAQEEDVTAPVGVESSASPAQPAAAQPAAKSAHHAKKTHAKKTHAKKTSHKKVKKAPAATSAE